MLSVSRLSGAKATGWFKNRFRLSLIKLTVLYAAILAVILFISSAFIHTAFSSRLERRFGSPGRRPVIVEGQTILPPTAEQVRSDLLRSITIVNSLLFVVAGLLSYLLAELTLRPLEKMHEGQRRFFGDASHELRTPLSILQIELENSLAEATGREASRITSQLEEVRRMSQLVGDLLTLSRFDEGVGLGSTKERIDLSQLVQTTVDRFQKLAEQAQVELTSSVEENIFIISDQTIFTTALANLIKNAISYNRPAGKVGVVLKREKNQAVIIVEDTGVGLSPEDLAKVFDRFYRSDTSRSSQTGGSGLGLSIVRSSLKYLGGTIGLTSELGKGTVATVTIPLL